MKAMTYDRYGSPDVLSLASVEVPEPGEGEVLVQVRAAGVHQGTWHLVAGMPKMIRLMGFGFRRPKRRIPMADVAGVVSAIGPNVTRFAIGDEVFGVAEGGYAEYAVASVDKLAPKPANVTFEQAATVPVSACAALKGLRDAGGVSAGQRVLVLGAGGGVGSFAVQLAKHFGAHVTGVCSTSKVELVRSLGADEMLDYTNVDVTDGSRTYDLILDTGGHRTLSQLRHALTPRGTLVLVGSETSGTLMGGFDRSLRAVALSPLVRQRLRSLMSSERASDLELLGSLIESGAVTPALDRTFQLGDLPEAIRYMRDRKVHGKAAVTV